MTDETAIPRRRRPIVTVVAIVTVALLVGGALIGVLGIAGGGAPAPTPSVGATDPARPADPALTPDYPEPFTADSAGTESTRLADAIVGRINPDVVVNDDQIGQVVPATEEEAAYFAVLHTITLLPGVPPTELTGEIVAQLGASGWVEQDSDEQNGFTRVILVSGTDPATSWLVLVGADASVPGQSVVSVQLASPDLP